MNHIGIISVPEKKKNIRTRLLCPVVIKEAFGKNPHYSVAELAYSESELKTMRTKKLVRLMQKATAILKSNGAEAALPSDVLREIIENYHPKLVLNFKKSYKIPPNRISFCFLKLWSKINEQSRYGATLTISDKDLRGVSLPLLEELCTTARQITIRTDKLTSAQRIADDIFCEYGVLIKVEPYTEKKVYSYSFIDADEGRIRIGDCIADGAEFISNSGIYKLDPAEEAVYLCDENFLEIKSLLVGQNKVKIS